MTRLSKRSMRMAVASAPDMMNPSLEGVGARAREAQRMVDEKVAAACEGVFAAQMAWGNLFLRAALGGVRSVEDMTFGLAGVAQAAVAPAHRTVRANARRLTGR